MAQRARVKANTAGKRGGREVGRERKSNNNMTPNDTLLYSDWFPTLPSSEAFLLQQMGTKTETHSKTSHTERDLETQSSRCYGF